MAQLVPLTIPPGVFRNGTNYQSAGWWWDANLVRWFEGTIMPVRGWQKAATTLFTGVCRGLLPWRDNLQNRWCAIGTNSKLYVYNGGSVYDITPAGFVTGRVDSFPGIGFGYGPYGSANFGAAPHVVDVIDANTWQMDNWGEWLVAFAISDGRLFQWQRSIGAPALVIPNAPINNQGMVVTSEQYLMALGAGGDVRHIMWCNQGDFTVWTPTALNTAGDIRVQSQGRLIAGRRLSGQVLVWTDTDIHALNYLGPPLVYGIERKGGNCELIGPNAVVVAEAGAVWMGFNGFFLYNGSVQPVQCDVADYIFSDFNMLQKAKVYAGHNMPYGEIWWFYPSASATENNRYVVWNYRENHWSIGSLARTAWTDMSVFPYPLATDAAGQLWEHENGWTAGGLPLTSTRYTRSGPIQIAAGDRVLSVTQVLADERTSGQVTLKFSAQMTPESPKTIFGPYFIKPYTDVRLTGRQISSEIVGQADADWRVGTLRLDSTGGGRR